jgi:hypothetical protein
MCHMSLKTDQAWQFLIIKARNYNKYKVLPDWEAMYLKLLMMNILLDA